MRYHLYALCAALSGCTTVPTTGRKRLLGILPVPFTGTSTPVEPDSKLAILVGQLEKFSWIGIVLVIAGAFWWKMSGGSTGLGKLAILIGSVFIALALFLPQIAGWITIAVSIAIVLAVGYQVWFRFFKKKP